MIISLAFYISIDGLMMPRTEDAIYPILRGMWMSLPVTAKLIYVKIVY